MTESQLISRAKKRERAAQSKLYALYKTYWYMLCLRYNRNEHDALDVLQDAMIQIFTKIDQFDASRGNFKSWSGRIIINQNLMFLRKRKLSYSLDDEETSLDVETYHDSAIDMLSAQELMKLVQKLPDGYRAVFNLYVLEGYSHKEIATLLHINEGTSKSQLFKAKKMLREELEVLYTT